MGSHLPLRDGCRYVCRARVDVEFVEIEKVTDGVAHGRFHYKVGAYAGLPFSRNTYPFDVETGALDWPGFRDDHEHLVDQWFGHGERSSPVEPAWNCFLEGHVGVDVGLLWSYCKHCDCDLVFNRETCSFVEGRRGQGRRRHG